MPWPESARTDAVFTRRELPSGTALAPNLLRTHLCESKREQHMNDPKESEAELAKCEETIEHLSEENELLRQSSQAFGDLAERLNARRRVMAGVPPEQRHRPGRKASPDKPQPQLFSIYARPPPRPARWFARFKLPPRRPIVWIRMAVPLDPRQSVHIARQAIMDVNRRARGGTCR